MRAILLAGGIGSRLRPLTDTVPKCLVPINGKPLLQYWFEMLFDAGIERALVNTHHLATQVQSFVSASAWRDRIELVHEDSLLGTGGTVLRNRDFVGNEAFLVAHADNLTRFDVAKFVAGHFRRPPGVEITMMTFATDAPKECGIVALDDRGVVVAFHEKVANPPGNLANGAVYIFGPSVFDHLERLGRDQIDISTEVLPHYLGRIVAFHNDQYHRDIGTPQSLAKARADFSRCNSS